MRTVAAGNSRVPSALRCLFHSRRVFSCLKSPLTRPTPSSMYCRSAASGTLYIPSMPMWWIVTVRLGITSAPNVLLRAHSNSDLPSTVLLEYGGDSCSICPRNLLSPFCSGARLTAEGAPGAGGLARLFVEVQYLPRLTAPRGRFFHVQNVGHFC